MFVRLPKQAAFVADAIFLNKIKNVFRTVMLCARLTLKSEAPAFEAGS